MRVRQLAKIGLISLNKLTTLENSGDGVLRRELKERGLGEEVAEDLNDPCFPEIPDLASQALPAPKPTLGLCLSKLFYCLQGLLCQLKKRGLGETVAEDPAFLRSQTWPSACSANSSHRLCAWQSCSVSSNVVTLQAWIVTSASTKLHAGRDARCELSERDSALL